MTTAIEALVRARSISAQKSANWRIETQRADSAMEGRFFEGMARGADIIEAAIAALIEQEKAASLLPAKEGE